MVVVLINELGGDVYYGGVMVGFVFVEIVFNVLRILNVVLDKDVVVYVEGKDNDVWFKINFELNWSWGY